MNRSSNKKVFLLGLDGATFDLMKPWMKEGLLPNFSRLLKEGCHGGLESIMPPLTTPAWASFMTGKNPGKHGIFDFAERKPGSYDIQWVTSLSRRGRSLWKIISSHDKQVVVINIPNNYPLEEVNGYMVAWMDAILPGRAGGAGLNTEGTPRRGSTSRRRVTYTSITPRRPSSNTSPP